ncbi:MAG: PilC/PilY family type IV pilus protein [Betaproteobacteria bacterium]|nr:PilC/PilY family type IV pilus protein [Betaproteobacteria bacterium]
MTIRIRKFLLAACLLAFHLPGMADDTDLFMGVPPSPTDLPNVMLVIDNAANFSSSTTDPSATCTIGGATNTLHGTVGGIEQCALYTVISAVPTDTPVMNVGIMFYNGSSGIVDINGATCTGSTGGCLAAPLKKLDGTQQSALLEYIARWTTNNGIPGSWIKANKQKTGAVQQETWAYFYGHTGLSGRSYASIKPTLGCHTYLVFIGNSYGSAGSPGDSTGDAGPANALLGLNSNPDMNATPLATTDQKAQILSTIQTDMCGTYTFPSANHETGGFYADEWSRYLAAQTDKTYTIGLLGDKCQASYAALLTSMADVGKGKYYPTTDRASLVSALQNILSEVQSNNSAFAAVSLPVSVNTQGAYLNQVFIGMFRPDENALPRWYGNLKQYKLGYLNGTLQLLDADGGSAISGSGTGFISECARSFWTPPTSNPDKYWFFEPEQNCMTVANSGSSNTPDGNIVQKGAQGYLLRGGANFLSASYKSRTVYTCDWTNITSCTGLAAFDTSITPDAFGLSSGDTTGRDLLVKWEKGQNNTTDTNDLDWQTSATRSSNSNPYYDIRPSVHGDVVHSRPVAIDYGTAGSPQVVVFYGGNDGMLRAVNGNRDGGGSINGPNGTAVPPGGELWSFVPPEFYPNIKRIRDNSVPVSYPGNLYLTTPKPKPYGLDGAVTAYNAGSTKWIYATMRRGGSAVYAFDVSTPGNPVLKWKRGCDSTGCASGSSTYSIGNIGQTWSSPKVLKAPGQTSGGVMTPMLIMGGGYDTCEDSDTTACTTPTKGSDIYVFDADTGTLLKDLPLPGGRGVVSDVFVVPDPLNPGQAIYAYVGDMGGNIWRVNIGTAAPADWTVTQIASLGCDTVTNCFPNRKFEFMPDVVYDNGKYDLLIGSGDREKPLATYTGAYGVNNYFFMVQDDPSDSTWLSSESNNCGGNSVICLNSLVEIPLNGTSPTPATVALHKGWYLQLNPHEQVVTSAITIFGTVTFSTHIPVVYEEGQCTPTLGTANVYNISYVNGGGVYGDTERFSNIAGGGLAPSPVAGMVTLDGSTTAVPFCIGCNPQSALQGGSPPPPPPLNQPKSRVYWQIER